jgi:hypothetical protein
LSPRGTSPTTPGASEPSPLSRFTDSGSASSRACLGGPGSAHPTWGRVRTRILAPERLQFLLLRLPVGSGLRIFRRPSVHQVLSFHGVHPLADELGHLLFTNFVLPGAERFLLLPLCSPLLLLGLASSPFRPLAAMVERLGLAKTLQSRTTIKHAGTEIQWEGAGNRRQDGYLPGWGATPTKKGRDCQWDGGLPPQSCCQATSTA